MTRKLTCTIPRTPDFYDIEIEAGSLERQASYLSTLASRFAIITDDKVAALYGEQLSRTLISAGLENHLFSFPGGEQNKTRATKELVENQLFNCGLGRDTCVIALGGGVVTDIAGYIAATYCRGIPLVMIPTSLLGMVDASLGGKTGVNVPHGKNMLGCIYQPKKVVIDPLTLKSLPKKELSNGVVEMIKHGLIDDLNFFEFLERHSSSILTLDLSIIEDAIFESCRIKKKIIEQDEKESSKRRLLNFGHTIGHALEKTTNYALSHGEAVATGILVESYISTQLGKLPQSSFARIQTILIKFGLPQKLPDQFNMQAIFKAMAMDKKSIEGKPRFVIIENIGSPCSYHFNYCTAIDESLINQALNWMNDDLRRH